MAKTVLKKKKSGDGKSKNKPLGVSIAVICLAIVVLLIILGKFLSFILSLDYPYSPDSKIIDQKQYLWDGRSTLNLVLKGQRVDILSYNPVQQTILLLKLPNDTYMNLPMSYGNWPVGSIYQLGQVENPPIGARLLKESVSEALGIPIDDYIIFSGKDANLPVETTVDNIRHSVFYALGTLGSIKTDLSLSELNSLYWDLSNVRFDKVKVVDLGTSQITQSLLLPDGSRVLALNTLLLDQFLQGQLLDSTMASEGVSVAVENATSRPQLAAFAARMINNLGGRVIFTDNSPVSLEKSVVIETSVSPVQTYTQTRLTQIFSPDCLPREQLLFLSQSSTGCLKFSCTTSSGIINDCLAKDPTDFTSRADITVYLGEDFYKRMNDRTYRIGS